MKQFLSIIFLLLPSFLFSQNKTIDARAVSISDSVIQMMGGKQNWDNVHFLRWNFFGRRTLYWDKWTGNVRIEVPAKKLLILTNINTKQGHVFRDNKELLQPDSIAYFMDRGYKIWANDSYWLIMPFKLKDPGVNVAYKSDAKDAEGTPCFLLELTFNNVGVTPDNKYNVYVDRKNYLVTQWDYFEKYSDEKPETTNPWKNYQRYGKVLLSDDRGPEEGKLADIAVIEEVREGLFEKQ
ncbi:MAG: hypothetical protein ABIO46_11410 [Chitinophagales bacterium]